MRVGKNNKKVKITEHYTPNQRSHIHQVKGQIKIVLILKKGECIDNSCVAILPLEACRRREIEFLRADPRLTSRRTRRPETGTGRL